MALSVVFFLSISFLLLSIPPDFFPSDSLDGGSLSCTSFSWIVGGSRFPLVVWRDSTVVLLFLFWTAGSPSLSPSIPCIVFGLWGRFLCKWVKLPSILFSYVSLTGVSTTSLSLFSVYLKPSSEPPTRLDRKGLERIAIEIFRSIPNPA